MANLVTDNNRLGILLCSSHDRPAADRLYRDRNVFFVGGALPVYETLETMFNSYCTEATSLFYLTFGLRNTQLQGEEMARQIKKNFNVRLMASLEPSADAASLERIYAAGVDNVVFPLARHEDSATLLPPPLLAARNIFPRWGVAATLQLGDESIDNTRGMIDFLLRQDIVPLLQVTDRSAGISLNDTAAVLAHLARGWEQSSVLLQAYLPLISVITPLVEIKPAGLLRGFVDRLRDRRQLAESDIRRHLRVQQGENSLDSAGL